MNIHQPNDPTGFWRGFEFRGKRWTKGGFTWVRAKYKVLNVTWYYCFEENCCVDRETYLLMGG